MGGELVRELGTVAHEVDHFALGEVPDPVVCFHEVMIMVGGSIDVITNEYYWVGGEIG